MSRRPPQPARGWSCSEGGEPLGPYVSQTDVGGHELWRVHGTFRLRGHRPKRRALDMLRAAEPIV